MKTRVEMLFERTFLFDPNIYMSMVVTIEGDINKEELCEAVKKAYTQNQMTMSKAVLDEQGNLYMEEMDKTGCKVLEDNRDWLEILHENERKPFHIDEGELIRTFIIPRGKQTDIYLMVHHITCDGNGIFMLVEDILSNLQGKPVAYRTSTVMTKEGVINRGNLNFVQKLGLKKCNQKWATERKVFTWEDYYKVHEEFWKDKETEIDFKEIEGSDLEQIKEVCKKYNVTVNGYIVTKLLQKYPEYERLGIPISIRGEDRSVSCMVSSVGVITKYNTNKTFEENLVIIDKAIKKEYQNDKKVYYIPQFMALTEPTLLDAAYIQHWLGYESAVADVMRRVLGLYGDTGIQLGVTNLGVVKIPAEYEGFKITKIIPVAPRIATSQRLITISTYNGKMLIADNKIKNR